MEHLVKYTVSASFEVIVDRDTPEDAQSDVYAWGQEDIQDLISNSSFVSLSELTTIVKVPHKSMFSQDSYNGFKSLETARLFAQLSCRHGINYTHVAGDQYIVVQIVRGLTDFDLNYEYPDGAEVVSAGAVGVLTPFVSLEYPESLTVMLPLDDDETVYWVQVPANSVRLLEN